MKHRLIRITSGIIILLVIGFNMAAVSLFAAQPEVAKGTDGGWYYYEEGEVNETYTGLAENNEGVWYIKDGEVDFSFNDFVFNAGDWRIIINGKLSQDADGFFRGKVDGEEGVWLVKGGVVQLSAAGPHIWNEELVYVTQGRIDGDFTGIAEYDGNFFAFKSGRVDTEKTGLFKENIGGETAWWYFRNGQVAFNEEGVKENENGWWKVKNGKVDFDFTGIGENENGNWYLRDGKVDFDFSGAVSFEDRNWLVRNGKAIIPSTDKEKTLFRAYRVLEKITKNNMPRKDKLKCAWDYVQSMEENNPRIPHYTGMDWPEIYANDVFVNKEGNCLSYAAALAYLAKAIGYEEVYGCNSGGHGWAEIDGLIYDPEWALHHDEYSYYGITYSTETDQPYEAAIWEKDDPGCEWMKIKI